jgi:hypothetical protein
MLLEKKTASRAALLFPDALGLLSYFFNLTKKLAHFEVIVFVEDF